MARSVDVFSPGHKETRAMCCKCCNMSKSKYGSSLQSERSHDVAVPQLWAFVKSTKSILQRAMHLTNERRTEFGLVLLLTCAAFFPRREDYYDLSNDQPNGGETQAGEMTRWRSWLNSPRKVSQHELLWKKWLGIVRYLSGCDILYKVTSCSQGCNYRFLLMKGNLAILSYRSVFITTVTAMHHEQVVFSQKYQIN